MVWTLWKKVVNFLVKLKKILVILPLGIHPQKTNSHIHQNTCTRMHIAALLIINKNWKHFNIYQLGNR